MSAQLHALAPSPNRFRPLSESGLEDLAARQIANQPTGGVLFARKAETAEKDAARGEILAFLGDKAMFPTLRMLTMPGLMWKFERKLLGKREGDWFSARYPSCTKFVCVENDRTIYHAAAMQMPGMKRANEAKRAPNPLIQDLGGTKLAERVISNPWVERYYFANVDDVLQDRSQRVDAAWLDYTGPLTMPRLKAISEFYANNVRRALIVTSLRSRKTPGTVAAIAAAGGFSALMRDALPGSVVHEIDYQDGASPMTQFAVMKARA